MEKTYNELILIYDKVKEFGESYIKEVKIGLIPDTVAYNYTPNFQSTQILGRFTPIYTYQSGSDEVYSFSLKVHEDLIDLTKYKNIQDFVDTIKSMSYPRERNGILVLPRVYIQLGEIEGFGLINTSINWALPLREGRYVVADIDFSFTIETPYKSPEIYKLEKEVEGLNNAEYANKVISYRFEEHYNYIYKPEDYVNNTGSAYRRNIFEYYDHQLAANVAPYKKLEIEYAKLEKLYGVFRKTDIISASRMSDIRSAIDYSNRLTFEGFSNTLKYLDKESKVPGLEVKANSTTYMTELDQGKHLKEVEEFLDSYIEKNLWTRFGGSKEEADKFKKEIKTQVLDVYANIYELWRGAMTYSSSN